ncbi:hypothetical protein [Neisseria chenwenguii]|uniref:hypothetical protein n=1 Tax=Neisseria chenwenguii TaxID=1853278 RepID=UPI001E550AF3|nr:hypothetical protein [Neisseria chenwenguii]
MPSFFPSTANLPEIRFRKPSEKHNPQTNKGETPCKPITPPPTSSTSRPTHPLAACSSGKKRFSGKIRPSHPKKKCSRDNSLLRKMLNIPSDGGVTFTPGHFLDSGEDGILVSPEPIV